MYGRIRLRWEYPAVTFLALICEAVYALWSYGVANNVWWMAMLSTFLLPFVNLLGVAFFIDAKTWPERIKIASWEAFGYAMGSAIVMWYTSKGG